MSPTYSTLAQANLLKLVDCKTMLAPEARLPAVDAINESYEMRLYQIPTLGELLDEDHAHYPFTKTFEQARDEPLVVLHTSGTTGLPKPIIWTHAWAASFARQRELIPPSGFDSSDKLLLGNRLLSLMPASHVSVLHTRSTIEAYIVMRQCWRDDVRYLIGSRPGICLAASYSPSSVIQPSSIHSRRFLLRPNWPWNASST